MQVHVYTVLPLALNLALEVHLTSQPLETPTGGAAALEPSKALETSFQVLC